MGQYDDRDIIVAERLARLEEKIDDLAVHFTNHLHAHQWWWRLLVAVLVTAVVNLVISLVR